MTDRTDIPTLSRILRRHRRVAVVGLSANWHRPSNFAAKYLQEHRYRVIPVNPAYEEVLGERCYPDLKSVPEPVEIVNSSASSMRPPRHGPARRGSRQ